ncbi:MAG TPA: Arc family DNA-binding protein [Gaiellaceae bacterium]|nr:Arc family DNA-binding protein [Gaiellaceae bacterium]
MPRDVYARLAERAARNGRSPSAEALALLTQILEADKKEEPGTAD